MAVTSTPQTGGAIVKGRGAQPPRVGSGLLDPKMLWKSLPDAFRKLDPRVQVKNPVMFVLEVGALLTLYTGITKPSVFNWTIHAWHWLTVLVPNTTEAAPKSPRKAQAQTRR